MKRFVRILFLVSSFFVVCSTYAMKIAFTPPGSLRGVDLYNLIGIKDEYEQKWNEAWYTSEVKAIQEKSAQLDPLKQKMDDAYKKYKDMERVVLKVNLPHLKADWEAKRDAYERMIYELTLEIIKRDIPFNQWADDTIKKACKSTRVQLRKDIEEREDRLKLYPPEQMVRRRIESEISEAKTKLSQTAEGCPFLLNKASRAQYDYTVFWKAVTLEEVEAAYARVRNAVESKMRLAPGTRIFLNEIAGDLLSKVDIPGPAVKLFNQNLALTNLHVLPKPRGEGIKYYVGFSGTTEFNNFTLTVNVYIIWDFYNKMRWSVSVSTPTDYRLTNMFPSLKALNWMVFPQGKFLVSSFNGTDAEGFSFQKGLNFFGQWDIFSGPLAFFKRLQTAAPKLEGLVFEAKPIQLGGHITYPNPLRSDFKAVLPLYLGIDFTKISKLPTSFTSVINKLTTDALELSIKPYQRRAQAQEQLVQQEKEKTGASDFGAGFAQPPTPYEAPAAVSLAINSAEKLGFMVEGEAGAILYLGTQRDPIKFILSGWAIPPSIKYPQGFISLSGQLKNMIEFGWFAIGNAAIVLDFDLAALDILILFGIPVSGFFVNGQLDLGKPGASRASLKVGGGISVAATHAIDNVVFDVSAENIRPTDFARYLGYQMMRSKYTQKGTALLTAQGEKLYEKLFPKGEKIPELSLPELIFHRVWGYFSFDDITIGKERYRRGIGVALEFEFMQKKAGFQIFIDKRDDAFHLDGFGYAPPLSLTVKGQNLFKLYNAHDPKKGAYVTWNMNTKQLLKGGSMGINGVVEIPALALKHSVVLDWSGYIAQGEIETEIAGFSFIFGLTMDTKVGEITQKIVDIKLRGKDEKSPFIIAAQQLLDEAKKQTPLTTQLILQANKLVEAAPKRTRVAVTAVEELSLEEMGKANKIALFAQSLAALENQLRDIKPAARKRGYNSLIRAYEGDYLKPKSKITIDELLTRLKEVEAEWRGTSPVSVPPKEAIPDDLAKWKGLLVTIGFKNMNELSKRISEQMLPALQKMKESLLKKIEAIDAKAQRWEQGTIDPTKEREAIAAREAKITQMKEVCRKRPVLKRASCETAIKAQQSLLLKDKAILKAFVESKASKNVKRVVAIGYQKAKIGKALKAATEKTLNTISATADAIAKGIDVLKLKEVRGRYSVNEMLTLKLPLLEKLIGEITIEGKTIPVELYNLQFDLKNPMSSISAIAGAVSKAFIKVVQKEFLSEIPSLLAAIGNI